MPKMHWKMRAIYLESFLLILAMLIFMFVGCSGKFIKLNVTSVKDLNPGANKEAHPIWFKLYFLKQKENFESQTYSFLWNIPPNSLGEDLLGNPIPIEIAPQDTIADRKIPKPKGALYVGIVAGYHKPAADGWRKVIVLTGKNVTFKLKENQIEIE